MYKNCFSVCVIYVKISVYYFCKGGCVYSCVC